MPKNGELITIIVKKDGFKEELLTIPYGGFGVMNNQLFLKLKPDESKILLSSTEDLLKRLFLAQKFALSQQFERALIEVDQILKQHPKFTRALTMKGSVYFAQKKYEDSLKWYEEALKIDPDMDETVKLTAKVRQLLGQNRAPAGR